jgi:pyruvate/2-oxoglutarate/acetoin dehydrogenase E1 component
MSEPTTTLDAAHVRTAAEPATETRTLHMVGALNDALHVEMARDERVMLLGEDVGVMGGAFRVSVGLRDRFGSGRCVDTPLSEAGIVGSAVGLTLAGLRPICEIQFDGSCYPILDQVICHVGRYRWRSHGKSEMSMVIRMPYGGGVGAPELHEDSPEAYFVHTPGVKVAIPSTPADAKGLLAAAIRDPDPVVILEPKKLYRSLRGEVPEGEHVVELGRARLVRPGSDLTLLAYGAMVPVVEAAAAALAESAIDAEVIDLRSLKPLDEEAIVESVSRTGRCVIVHEAPRTLGFGAEVAALVAERCLLDLRAPVTRVTGYDVPAPYPALSSAYVPDAARVVAAARAAMRF